MGWLGKHDPPPPRCPWSGKKLNPGRNVDERYDGKNGRPAKPAKGSNWKWSKK